MPSDDIVSAARAVGDEAEAARGELYSLCSADVAAYLESDVGAKLARVVELGDLEQEAFVSAFEALPRLEEVDTLEGFRALVLRHARWRVFKEVRRHRRFEGESALGTPLAERVPEAGVAERTGEVTRVDRSDWLAAHVDRLAGASAEVLRLRLMGAEFADIARELDLKEDAVRRRYLRGINELRGLMREPGS